MAIRSFWLENQIDEEKLKKVAKAQNKSVSKLLNSLIKEKYNVFKDLKK